MLVWRTFRVFVVREPLPSGECDIFAPTRPMVACWFGLMPPSTHLLLILSLFSHAYFSFSYLVHRTVRTFRSETQQKQAVVRAVGHAPGSDEAAHEGSSTQGGQAGEQGGFVRGLETVQVCVVM